MRPSWELDEADWREMIDINLGGVWHTTKAAVPHLIERGPGGSIVLISSTAGPARHPRIAHYNAAKHGVLGLARTLANELAPYRIRVNSVHPTNVRTVMIDNPSSARIYRPDLESPTFEDSLPALAKINMWDVPYVDVEDVANAVLFLACEESRYVTGAALPVDLGMSQKYSAPDPAPPSRTTPLSKESSHDLEPVRRPPGVRPARARRRTLRRRGRRRRRRRRGRGPAHRPVRPLARRRGGPAICPTKCNTSRSRPCWRPTTRRGRIRFRSPQ